MYRNISLQDRKKNFLEKMNEKYGNLYNFDNINYINSHTEIEYICNETNQLLKNTPWNLIQRKLENRRSFLTEKELSNKTLDEQQEYFNKMLNNFIEKANKIHNNKYDYSKAVYKKALEKVIITCPIHGDFTQRISTHLQGKGCKFCGFLIIGDSFHAQLSKYKLFYILFCYDQETKEYFYKCGITSDLVKRYGNLKGLTRHIPYCYEIVYLSNKNALIKEKFFLQSLAKYRYYPKLKFQGHSECFKLTSKKYKRKIKKLITNYYN